MKYCHWYVKYLFFRTCTQCTCLKMVNINKICIYRYNYKCTLLSSVWWFIIDNYACWYILMNMVTCILVVDLIGVQAWLLRLSIYTMLYRSYTSSHETSIRYSIQGLHTSRTGEFRHLSSCFEDCACIYIFALHNFIIWRLIVTYSDFMETRLVYIIHGDQ